jgi:hypothetical protein
LHYYVATGGTAAQHTGEHGKCSKWPFVQKKIPRGKLMQIFFPPEKSFFRAEQNFVPCGGKFIFLRNE